MYGWMVVGQVLDVKQKEVEAFWSTSPKPNQCTREHKGETFQRNQNASSFRMTYNDIIINIKYHDRFSIGWRR